MVASAGIFIYFSYATLEIALLIYSLEPVLLPLVNK